MPCNVGLYRQRRIQRTYSFVQGVVVRLFERLSGFTKGGDWSDFVMATNCQTVFGLAGCK
jgi:hypothetical protein